jgi:hypothetical protein
VPDQDHKGDLVDPTSFISEMDTPSELGELNPRSRSICLLRNCHCSAVILKVDTRVGHPVTGPFLILLANLRIRSAIVKSDTCAEIP